MVRWVLQRVFRCSLRAGVPALWVRWEFTCSALLSAEAAPNRCDVMGGTCFGDLSWLLSEPRRIMSPSLAVGWGSCQR